jgi:hypothetical protein
MFYTSARLHGASTPGVDGVTVASVEERIGMPWFPG